VRRLRRIVAENSLSLATLTLFVLALLGQILCGHAAYNDDRRDKGEPPVAVLPYLTSGHFVEAVFENWESEFLEMSLFVLLSVKLRQKGSTESKPLDTPFAGDEEPRAARDRAGVPWPVKHGGAVLRMYEHSLSIAFVSLFLLSFVLHAKGGCLKQNEQRASDGKTPLTLVQFIGSSEFWFESLQNWQSEFLSITTIVVFTIFLRERGSPQSKPVAERHSKTGG